MWTEDRRQKREDDDQPTISLDPDLELDPPFQNPQLPLYISLYRSVLPGAHGLFRAFVLATCWDSLLEPAFEHSGEIITFVLLCINKMQL